MRQLFDFCRCLRFEISARRIRVNISVTKCCFWFRNRYQIYRRRNTCSNFWRARLFVNKIFRFVTINSLVFDKVTGYNHTNLLSIMILSVEHFHSTTHVKKVLMTQLQDARDIMRSIKEALKRLLFTLQVGKLAGIHLQKMMLTSEISPPFCHQKLCLHQ